MLSLFIIKKKQKQVIQNNNQERVANRIVIKCIRLQQQWAAFMQHHTDRLPLKAKVFMLFIFCLCAGGCSFLLIARSLMSNHAVSLRVTRIKTSAHIGEAGDERIKATLIVTKAEYYKIHRFSLYMDSLKRSASGKKHYDGILSGRPGLLDSINLIENIYQSQTKK